MFDRINEMTKYVKKSVDESRFIHTIGVRDASFYLAIIHGENQENAFLAGLLHDNAKCLADDVLLSECERYGLEISEDERLVPYLLHGKLGAYYAKTKLGVEDEDVLNAIIYHTTGRVNMSLLEKIVFVADFIEPGRDGSKIPNMETIRQVAFKDIDKAVLMILKNTIDYLTSKHATIDRTTLDAYQFYLNTNHTRDN